MISSWQKNNVSLFKKIKFGAHDAAGNQDSPIDTTRFAQSVQQLSRCDVNQYPGLNMVNALLHMPLIQNSINDPDAIAKFQLYLDSVQNHESEKYEIDRNFNPNNLNGLYQLSHGKEYIKLYQELLTRIVPGELNRCEDSIGFKLMPTVLAKLKTNEALTFPPSQDRFERSQADATPAPQRLASASSQSSISSRKAKKTPEQRFQIIQKSKQAAQHVKSQIFDQDNQIDAIKKFFDDVAKGTHSMGAKKGPNRISPSGVLLLYGPSGTGKTESINTFCEAYGRKFIKFPLNANSEGIFAEASIVGPAAGYTGSETDYLAKRIKKAYQEINETGDYPPVLFLDELDKTTPKVLDMLMLFAEDATLEDRYNGEPVKAPGITIIFSSNFLASELSRSKKEHPNASYEDFKKRNYKDQLAKVKAKNKEGILTEQPFFQPYHLDRFSNNLIPFYPLSDRAKKAIIESQIATVCKNIEENDYYGFLINVTTNARKRLLEIDLGESEGGRSLKDKVTTLIQNAVDQFDENQPELEDWPAQVKLEYDQGNLVINTANFRSSYFES